MEHGLGQDIMALGRCRNDVEHQRIVADGIHLETRWPRWSRTLDIRATICLRQPVGKLWLSLPALVGQGVMHVRRPR